MIQGGKEAQFSLIETALLAFHTPYMTLTHDMQPETACYHNVNQKAQLNIDQ